MVTAQEYLDSTDLIKEWEWESGELLRRQFPTPDHARLIARTGILLSRYDWLTSYAGTFVVPVPAENRFRVPDVCCYDASYRPPKELDELLPPPVVFEVLSKSDPVSGLQRKCADYRSLGIEQVFIVHPEERVVLVPRRGGFESVESVEFEIGGNRADLTLQELFS